MRLLVDTAVLAYALGGEHPEREACVQLVVAAGAGDIELHASTEMVQELLFHRMRRGTRAKAVTQARDASELCFLHSFDAAVLTRALELINTHERLGGRDAVHAATALQNGITTIVSPDSAFDGIGGLTRITAAQAVSEHP